MYVLPLNRADISLLLPKSNQVAEIGVLEGAFARQILNRCKPEKLYLIDCYQHQTDSSYQNDKSNAPQDQQDALYQKVSQAFANEIISGQVDLIREYSHVAAKQIPDGSLDWVYIDANHSYDALLNDLKLYSEKLTDSGYILGHDFTNNPMAQRQGFSVVEAVNQFVAQSDFEIFAMNTEPFPTYILARPAQFDALDAMLQQVLWHRNYLVNIDLQGAGLDMQHDILQMRRTTAEGQVEKHPSIFTLKPTAKQSSCWISRLFGGLKGK